MFDAWPGFHDVVDSPLSSAVVGPRRLDSTNYKHTSKLWERHDFMTTLVDLYRGAEGSVLDTKPSARELEASVSVYVRPILNLCDPPTISRLDAGLMCLKEKGVHRQNVLATSARGWVPVSAKRGLSDGVLDPLIKCRRAHDV